MCDGSHDGSGPMFRLVSMMECHCTVLVKLIISTYRASTKGLFKGGFDREDECISKGQLLAYGAALIPVSFCPIEGHYLDIPISARCKGHDGARCICLQNSVGIIKPELSRLVIGYVHSTFQTRKRLLQFLEREAGHA